MTPADLIEKARWLQSYAANRVFIAAWNADPTNTCTLGETKWAHLTNTEFRALNLFAGRSLKNPVMHTAEAAGTNLRAVATPTRPTRAPTRSPTLKPNAPTLVPSSKPILPTKAPLTPTSKPSVPTQGPSLGPTLPTQAPVTGPPPAFDWTTQTVNGAPVVGAIKDQGNFLVYSIALFKMSII